MNASSKDWQGESVTALAGLAVEAMPAMELIYLDALAVHLMGPDAPVAPYSIEHGTAVVSLLLRAAADSAAIEAPVEPGDEDAVAVPARTAVVAGAHRFAERGGHGVHQLVTRLIGAVVGELERLKETPDAQVASLFHYGLLALASGPQNQASAETAESLQATFRLWDRRIGDGFVPAWRLVSAE
ncbi:hypothetical protein [Nocardioides jensenii]|uniref:hypothetical protein n=1 Tax=Nocardioides jensenii TaxID=1843 RepID=UPI00082F5406|nr:hypothetical protein [Nocardioides jensenii]